MDLTSHNVKYNLCVSQTWALTRHKIEKPPPPDDISKQTNKQLFLIYLMVPPLFYLLDKSSQYITVTCLYSM